MTPADQIRQSTDPAWMRKQLGAPVFYVTWQSENESGTAGPFDGVDDAAREAQNLLRADFRRVVTISPHVDDRVT